MDKILVLDFGSQYSHLICRRIREFSVFAELVPYDISYEEIQKHNPKGHALRDASYSFKTGNRHKNRTRHNIYNKNKIWRIRK